MSLDWFKGKSTGNYVFTGFYHELYEETNLPQHFLILRFDHGILIGLSDPIGS